MIQHAREDVGRLGIVGALLGDLDTATHGGERYTMGKILGLLRDEAANSEGRLSELQRHSITRSFEEMAREQARMLPDRTAFGARAQRIADALSICC
jgi:hypothetical protein